MQKFTRPLTREIELAGERLALTFDDQGISLRPVGSRKPPRTMSWVSLLCAITGRDKPVSEEPSPEELAEAVKLLKTVAPPAPTPAPPMPAEMAQPAQPAAAPAPAGNIPALLARLERWLAEHRPRCVQGLLPAASAADLDSLQTSLGLTLPAEMRELLSWRNGQSDEYSGCFERGWNLLSTWQVAAAAQVLRAESSTTGWQQAWVPVFEDDAVDYLCLDTSQPSAPVREFRRGKAEHAVIAASLTAWLEDFVNAVERGSYHEDPERGTLLRKG